MIDYKSTSKAKGFIYIFVFSLIFLGLLLIGNSDLLDLKRDVVDNISFWELFFYLLFKFLIFIGFVILVLIMFLMLYLSYLHLFSRGYWHIKIDENGVYIKSPNEILGNSLDLFYSDISKIVLNNGSSSYFSLYTMDNEKYWISNNANLDINIIIDEIKKYYPDVVIEVLCDCALDF